MFRLSHFMAPALLGFALMSQGCADPIQQAGLCKYVPVNQAVDPARQVEGKVAVVYKGVFYEPQFDNGCSLDGYKGGRATPLYFPEDMYARSPEELDTLIMIELQKGKFIRTTKYQRTVSVGSTVDVFSGRLTLSMIDYKTSTLVRTAVREFTKVPEKIDADQLKYKGSYENSEYVIEPTTAEIQAALKEFSKAAP